MAPGNGGTDAKVFISEQLKPDKDIDQALVDGAKLNLREANGAEQPLTLVKNNDALLVVLPGKGTRLVYGMTTSAYPEAASANLPAHLLSKAILGDAFDPQMTVGSRAPVESFRKARPEPSGWSWLRAANPFRTQKSLLSFPMAHRRR